MTKQEILDKFNDIDFVYNDSSKHETLSRMLDELLKEQEAVVRCKDCRYGQYCTDGGLINDKPTNTDGRTSEA